MPSSTAFTANAATPKPVARSPKIGADADDEVNLDSDDENPPAGKKRRASPAAELTAFLNDTPPPVKDSAQSISPRNNSPTPYLRSSPSVGSKLSVAEPSTVRSTAASTPTAAAAKPKERKGLKGLMSKVLGSGHSSHPTPPARSLDRSLISQPTAAAPGVAETMRARTAALESRANELDQPTRDLQDRSASVGFPSSLSPAPSASLRPPAADSESHHIRSRPTSALSSNSHMSFDRAVDRPDRPRAVSQISQTSTSASFVSGRPPSGTIPWLAGNEGVPQDRLKAPVRSMSISRKPVSPELRAAVDLPPISPMSSPSGGAMPLPIIDSPPQQHPDSPDLAASSRNGAVDSPDDATAQSPSRIQKSIASAAAHAAIAPPLRAFDTPARSSAASNDDEQPSPVDPTPLSVASASATEDEEPITPRAPLESTATPKILSVPYTPAAPVAPHANAISPAPTSVPSVPLSELIHLRLLLANASTADECRLLVNALLSLWKVPSAPSSPFATDLAADTSALEAQVARVFAWMLSEAGMPAVGSGAASIKHASPLAPPGTPFIIPPTPAEPKAERFTSDVSMPATIDEAASMLSSAEELEEAEYEARVLEGRAALAQAAQHA